MAVERWLVLAVGVLALVGCASRAELPDDDAVRAEVRPELEALFDVLGLEPEFEEGSGGCPAGLMGNDPALLIAAGAPADPSSLDEVARWWGRPVSDDVRREDGTYEYRARMIDGVLYVTGQPVCP